MSAFSGQDPFFGVYDRKGGCVAVGPSSDAAVEAARDRLGLSSAQEVMNQCSVAQIDRAAYERFLQRQFGSGQANYIPGTGSASYRRS